MIPIESLIPFMLASIILIASPGPDNLFVITQSAIHGSKTGILVTLGLVTGLIFHTSAVAFGVAALLQTSDIAFTILKTVGALYLIYLAWQAFSAHKTKIKGEKLPPRSASQLYRRGIIMNITNPKVSIFFLAFLPQFVAPENGAIAGQVFVLGAVFAALGLSIFIVFSLLAGKIGTWLNQSEKAQLYINRVAGVVFIGLALNLLTTSNHIEPH
ncbi:MAG: LysE family translocator [Thiotrichales bacterium]|nr:LysE family translocator [Thiotrichales bacterium]